jgi:hypothetical protein
VPHGKASLAALFREFGGRWEIEQIQRGCEWVACTRDGQDLQIVAARDIAGLRYTIEAAERHDPPTPGGPT